MDAASLEHIANVLRRHGYIVIPKERHGVLTARYAVPHYVLGNLRSGDHRWSDTALETNLRVIARKASDDGFMLHERHDLDDPVSGKETIFTTSVVLIKPKAVDEV